MSLLVPIDLSSPSRSAVQLAALLGEATGEDIVMLHVSEAPPSLDLLASLHGLAEPLRSRGLTARLRTRRGLPAQEIAAEAARRQARCIVMGTGHLGAPAKTTGSIARAVMLGATVPVAAVRPGDEGIHPRAIALVHSAAEDAAERVARLLATQTPSPLRALRCGAAQEGPLFLTTQGRPRCDLIVIAFHPRCPELADPDGGARGWCGRVLREERRPVVLVCDPRGVLAGCACGPGATPP